MGTRGAVSPGAGPRSPLGPLLTCAVLSIAVCVSALSFKAASYALRYLPVNWAALVGLAGLGALAELAFYALYWRRRRAEWNQQPCFPHAPGRLDAPEVFRRFLMASTADKSQLNLQTYLSLWFRGMEWEKIKRGNMEEITAYGFWYRTIPELEEGGYMPQLRAMVDKLEEIWDYKFPPGYTEGTQYMAHLWEDLKVQYRPLAFYMATEGAAAFSWAVMRLLGFQCHSMGDITYYTRGLDTRGRRSPGDPDAAATTPSAAAPILFLHGVGGLVIYLDFIRRIVALGGPVIAVDIRHVGMRLSPRIPCVDEMTSEILAILDAENVAKACVVGHSYGTLVASRLVKRFPSRLHSLCLVDPVCFGMYMPHLLHNFFYRKLVLDIAKPLQFFLDLIVYMASRELHLSTTFARRFYWSEMIMWPDDMPEGSTVVSGAADDLVHANEVHTVIENMCGDKVRSIYNPGLFHGAFLVFPDALKGVVDAVASMARSAACDSHALAEAAAHDAAAPLVPLSPPQRGGLRRQHGDEDASGSSPTGSHSRSGSDVSHLGDQDAAAAEPVALAEPIAAGKMAATGRLRLLARALSSKGKKGAVDTDLPTAGSWKTPIAARWAGDGPSSLSFEADAAAEAAAAAAVAAALSADAATVGPRRSPRRAAAAGVAESPEVGGPIASRRSMRLR